MRRYKPKQIIGWIIVAAGITLALFSFFSGTLGIDQDGGWGPARKFTLAIGVFLIVTAKLTDIFRYLGVDLRRLSGLIYETPSSKPIRATGPQSDAYPDFDGQLPKLKDFTLLTIVVVLIAACVGYRWLTTVGTWNEWPHTTSYYHLLAEGFRKGKSHLLVAPSEELLNLKDPYDYESREKVDFLWDASLFNGKYYIYWGPVPALITIMLEVLFQADVGDQVLGWLMSLLMLSMVLIFVRSLWRRSFRHLPQWLFIGTVIVLAFANPLPWLVTRPAVYESAIASGQIFFWGGMTLLIQSRWQAEKKHWKAVCAGILWVLAVGSRATLAVPIILVTSGLIVLDIVNRFRENTSYSGKIAESISLFAPLLIGAVLLAFYNYIRFDSFFELGHRYQLTSINMMEGYEKFYSSKNILPNAYNYLFNPFRVIQVFPYVKPMWGKYAVPFLRASASNWYTTEKITGIIISSPIILTALIPLVDISIRIWNRFSSLQVLRKELRDVIGVELHQVYFLLFLTGLLQFLPLLPISFISMRYAADFVYSGLILSAVGIYYLWERVKQNLLTKSIVAIGVSMLGLYTVVISILLAFTGYYPVFEELNPILFSRLTRFFTP
jgi:hypothetical protein